MNETSIANPTLDKLSKATEIASHLAVVFGVLFSAVQIFEYVDNSKRATQSAKLSSLKEIRAFLKEDEEIRRRGQHFLRDGLPAILPNIKEKVRNAGSGEAFYLSDEMADYAAVHYHYEQMGALIKLGYVDFPIVFEIVAFPDAYMEATKPIRAEVAANWKGAGKDLPDLGSNIDFLRRCYEQSRKDYTKPPSCPAK